MFCTQCGSQLKPDARFCTACGMQLAVAQAAPEGHAEPVEPVAPAEPQGGADTDVTAVMSPVAPGAVGPSEVPLDVYPAAAVQPQPYAQDWGAAAAQTFSAEVPVAFAPQPQASAPARSGDGLVWVAVVAAVLVLLAGGGALAWQQGWLDGVFGKESSAASASKDETDEDADAGDPDQGGVEIDEPGAGYAGDESDSGADPSQTGALSPDESYALLQEHYAKLWELHASIGLQDEGSYTGTGFVFEPGGFNASIGHSDRQVREDLVPRCMSFVDEVSDWRAQLEMAVVSPEFEGDRQNLVRLYGYLLERVDSMYQAAQIAVYEPDRDAGWGDALQPRSQDGRKAFEAEYPVYEPAYR